MEGSLQQPEPGLRRAQGGPFPELLERGQVVIRQETPRDLGCKLVWIPGYDVRGEADRPVNQVQRFPVGELSTDVVELQVVEANSCAVALRQRKRDKLLGSIHCAAGIGIPERLLNRRTC